jgi:hypothetical protein
MTLRDPAWSLCDAEKNLTNCKRNMNISVFSITNEVHVISPPMRGLRANFIESSFPVTILRAIEKITLHRLSNYGNSFPFIDVYQH